MNVKSKVWNFFLKKEERWKFNLFKSLVIYLFFNEIALLFKREGLLSSGSNIGFTHVSCS